MRWLMIFITIILILASGLFASDKVPTPTNPVTASKTSPSAVTQSSLATTPISAMTVTPGPSSPAEAEHKPALKVVGYITHWHIRNLNNINLNGLTHLIWQGVKVKGSDNPDLYIPNNDGWWQITEAVKSGHASGVRVLVSLMGQWNDPDLIKILESAEQRDKLIRNLVILTLAYSLDGIDFDNENQHCSEILNSVFIKELYDALNPLGKIITLAGSPYHVCIDSNASSLVEFVNVMTYDMPFGIGFPYHSTLGESIKAMELWSGSGIPKEKLLIGIPFYGRDNNTNFYEYRWIVQKYVPTPDQNEVKEPAASGGKIWWNGLDLASDKVDFVRDNGYGGVMMYEIGTDTNDSSSLLEYIYEAVNQTGEVKNDITAVDKDIN